MISKVSCATSKARFGRMSRNTTNRIPTPNVCNRAWKSMNSKEGFTRDSGDEVNGVVWLDWDVRHPRTTPRMAQKITQPRNRKCLESREVWCRGIWRIVDGLYIFSCSCKKISFRCVVGCGYPYRMRN